jgi:hypothetical protein
MLTVTDLPHLSEKWGTETSQWATPCEGAADPYKSDLGRADKIVAIRVLGDSQFSKFELRLT